MDSKNAHLKELLSLIFLENPVGPRPAPSPSRVGEQLGATTLSGFHRQFHLTRLRDVAREESPAYGDGSARRAHWVRL